MAIFPTPSEFSTLETSNPHAELHTEFNNQRLFKRLAEKHRPKPYWQQYRKLHLAVSGISFLFNILSIFTAAALVYFFLFWLTGNVIVSASLTGLLLAGLEFMKRETAAKLFHIWLQFKTASPGMVLAVICLSSISTTASYFGAEKTVKQFAAPPDIESVIDATADTKYDIKEIDGQIRDAKKSTWKGKVTPAAQKTIDRLAATKDRLVGDMVRTKERTDARNDAAILDHEENTNTSAAAFAAFTLICEIGLILCLFYIQYYDYRSFAEYAHAANGKKIATNASVTNSTSYQSQAYSTTGNHNGIYNGANNDERRKIGFQYGNAQPTQNAQTVANGPIITARYCVHCGTGYHHGHARQKYCSEVCRVIAWKDRAVKKAMA
jgi:hypothetical protein